MNLRNIFFLSSALLLLSCKPKTDVNKAYLDGAWIVEEMLIQDPLEIFEDEEALQVDHDKSKFIFDYSGNVRTPMGKRKFWFKSDQVLMIGAHQYLFEKVDTNRFKIHLYKNNGEAEALYIFKRIAEN